MTGIINHTDGSPLSAYGLADELAAGSRPAAPFSVDTSKGAVRGEVSAQWASRPDDQKFNTLSDLYDFTKGVWDNTRDVHLRSAEVTAISPSLDFATDGMSEGAIVAEMRRRQNLLTLGYALREGGDVTRHVEIAPTHHAFGQLCSYARFSKTELRKLPSSIACDVLNWQLRYGGTSDEVKLWAGDDELRAVQSPGYGRIADHELVAAVMGIAGDGLGDDPRFHWKAPGRLNWSNGTYDPEALGPKDDRTFYGSDRDVFMFLVDDRRPIVVGKTRDGKPDHMFRGFYVQNSMVGTRTLKLAAFYLRGVCMNRNLWGVEKFNETTIRHTSGAPARWLQEAKPAIEAFAHRSAETLIEGVQRAKAKVLVEDDKAGLDFLRKRLTFSDSAARKIMAIGEQEEGAKPRTVWDMGQAITAYARSARNTDDRLDIELKGKKVLDMVA